MEFSEAFSPVRALRCGIAALGRAPLALLLGAVLLLFADVTGSCASSVNPASIPQEGQSEIPPAAVMAAVLVVALLVGLFVFVVRCWITAGWFRLHRQVLVDGGTRAGTLFSGADTLGRMMGWRVLATLITLGTTVAAAMPGILVMVIARGQAWGASAGGAVAALGVVPASIYVGTGLLLGDRTVVLEGLGPMAALERSWELARGHRWRLIGFYIVTAVFEAIGLLACGVGVIFTRAASETAMTDAFLNATGVRTNTPAEPTSSP